MSGRIGKVYFKIMSNDEVVKNSNLQVRNANLYTRQGSIAQDGLLSSKLGVTENQRVCTVCREYRNNCLGHEGHIVLACPVINPCFRTLLSKILSRYCVSCDYLNSPDSVGQKTKCKKCKGLTLKLYDYAQKPYVLRGPDKKNLLPEEIEARVNSIKPQILKRDWGVTLNPKDLLIKNMVVTSPSIRPTTILKGVTYTDDLSVKLQTILEVNSRLRLLLERCQTPEGDTLKTLLQRNLALIYQLLCYHVHSYVDNKTAGMPVAIHRGGKVIKALLGRLQGKEGLFRHNLGAKRTDHSARSVISPSSQISLDSAGVSENYARTMTTPDLVTSSNAQWYRRLLIQNPDYPLIHNIECKNPAGVRVNYRVFDKNREELVEKIKPGVIVHRSVMTGDWAVLNRQPTLHQYGMMAHRVVVLKENPRLQGETLRINSIVCQPYNADYDGDQMNTTHPNRLSAINQVSLLMRVNAKMIDRKNGKPILGLSRQKVAMMYLLSRRPRTLTRAEAIRVLGKNALSRPLPQTLCSKDLLSYLLPLGYDYQEGGQGLCIKDGCLIKGYFNAGNCSKNSRWASHLSSYLGSEAYTSYLNELVKVLERYEYLQGLTLSLKDYQQLYRSGTVQGAEQVVQKAFEEGTSPTKATRKYLASHLNQFLAESKNSSNSALNLAISGASGSLMHLAQMTGIGGIRTIGGLTPKDAFTDCFRPYIHSKSGMKFAHGITGGNYLLGLPEVGFLLDCMMARDGLIISNIRIRDVGYNMRKLSYSMGDLVVDQDAMVRDSERNIVQLRFGGTGYNGWDYNPQFVNNHLLERMKSYQDGSLSVQEARSILDKEGYTIPVKETIAMHMNYMNKSLSLDSLLDLAQYLLMPIGAPVGMVAAHAVGERSGQMALDAKHAKGNLKGGMKDLFRLLERAPVSPILSLAGPDDTLKQIYEEYRPIRLAEVCRVSLHSDRGQVSVTRTTGRMDLLIRAVEGVLDWPATFAGIKGKIAHKDQDSLTITIPQESRSYTQYCSLLSLLESAIYSGQSQIESAILEPGKLIFTGSSKTPRLYRWMGSQKLPPGVNLTYHSPVYAQKIGGIELARKVLYEELVSLRGQGLDVNTTYLSLIADLMARDGALRALSRSGVVKTKSPLARCAFQSTKKVITELAVSQKKDDLRSPISSVICGAPVKVGPGYFTVTY